MPEDKAFFTSNNSCDRTRFSAQSVDLAGRLQKMGLLK
jgi:hypothetical protein